MRRPALRWAGLALSLSCALSSTVAGCASQAAPADDDVLVPRDLGGAQLWLSFETADEALGQPAFDDAAGGPARAVVVGAGGGTVELVDGADGSAGAVRFPARCASGATDACPRAMVEVAHHPELDPGDDDFEFGVSVRVAPDETTTGSNLVQKGRFGTEGGQWKLQIDDEEGEPSCVVRSALPGAAPVVVRSDVSVADSAWHRVLCRRDGDTVTIEVDGVAASEAGLSGSVGNAWPVRIGAPGVGAGDDQFDGDLDDVYLRITRR